jgi:outer membrane receptor protein involved in Fe transport
MKFRILFFCLLIMLIQPVHSETGNIQTDSLSLTLKEVVVTKSLRENAFLCEMPLFSSTLSGKILSEQQVHDLKSAAVYVPNLYIPDYGSPLTSAIYLRGVGTRMNTSAVGLYVDDVPYTDKSGYDFEWQDVQRLEVLSGPQGTLYGRNAMGGVIHIHTWSPFYHTGTRLKLSYGSFNELSVQASHAGLLSKALALSVSGKYRKTDGAFTNEADGLKVGAKTSAGIKTKLAGRFPNGWRTDFSLGFDYDDQQGYAYSPVSSEVINYNDPCSYGRKLFNTSLSIEKDMEQVVFHSVTGYQKLKDALVMDQDFSTASVFTLHQNQDLMSLTQEMVLKSNHEKSFRWMLGIFGSLSDLQTSSPVQFKQDGIASLLEDNINKNIPSSLNLNVDITDEVLDIPSFFKEKRHSLAFYDQFTWDLPIMSGLSLTGGLRIEYEGVAMDWNSSASMDYRYLMSRYGMSIGENLTADALLKSDAAKNYLQLTPKISLQYVFDARNRVYASFTKGYQSGGYNVQLFSDLIQTELQAVMSRQMKGSMASQLQSLVTMGMPQASVDAIVARIPVSEGVTAVEPIISYDPEYSWNYEAGFHSETVKDRLFLDGAVFYTDCYNRQITQFSPNGFGRMMKNAGKSHSLGFELSMQSRVLDGLDVNASYGFTDARFDRYRDSVRIDGTYKEVDYSGKRVPIIPKHTLSLGVKYGFGLSGILDRIAFGAQYHAAGPIYWTENNDVKQSFYGLTDAQISFIKNDCQLQCWVKNMFKETYRTFYFESLGNAFAQQGMPRQIGVTVQYAF